MNRAFSVYLDAVRFLAAVLVYLWHSNQRFLIDAKLPASNYGHSSVIVFFVLSGFVIAYVSTEKERSLSGYLASRISRVLSVTVPALAITLVVDAVGRQLYPAIYDYPWDRFPERIFASLGFMNEVWFTSITAFSNVPYWSICYEWWYYLLFAALLYLPRRLGIVLCAAMAALLGPKILLLAPIWWLGVILHRRIKQQWRLPHTSWLVLAASTIGIVSFHVFDVQGRLTLILANVVGDELHENLTFSKYFLSDYILAILVYLNFHAIYNLAQLGTLNALLRLERPIRFLAGFTFTLYLLHQPLFLFWGAVLRGNPDTPWYWMAVTALTFISIYAVGQVTEQRRFAFRRWLHRLLSKVPGLNREIAASR